MKFRYFRQRELTELNLSTKEKEFWSTKNLLLLWKKNDCETNYLYFQMAIVCLSIKLNSVLMDFFNEKEPNFLCDYF